MGVSVDGTLIERPELLSADEVSELARFNAERRAGYLYDAGTLHRMAQMQLRFDWLGYVTEDGAYHPGYRARPILSVSPRRRKWWQR
jgi:hypothetical protein